MYNYIWDTFNFSLYLFDERYNDPAVAAFLNFDLETGQCADLELSCVEVSGTENVSGMYLN